ncbi:hypothetical protein CR513_32309, partial [Mucuna pruriens]
MLICYSSLNWCEDKIDRRSIRTCDNIIGILCIVDNKSTINLTKYPESRDKNKHKIQEKRKVGVDLLSTSNIHYISTKSSKTNQFEQLRNESGVTSHEYLN